MYLLIYLLLKNHLCLKKMLPIRLQFQALKIFQQLEVQSLKPKLTKAKIRNLLVLNLLDLPELYKRNCKLIKEVNHTITNMILISSNNIGKNQVLLQNYFCPPKRIKVRPTKRLLLKMLINPKVKTAILKNIKVPNNKVLKKIANLLLLV